MTEDSRAFTRLQSVVRREVAGETFLVPIRGHLADLQELFVLNEVGSWVWDHLDGQRRLDELAAGLSVEFDVDEEQALSDAETFVRQLLEAGLAEESPHVSVP
jgi:hypothetical protein